MKLNYRGVSYDYNPPQVEYGDLAQSGKYRGLDIRFRNPKKVPVLQPTLDLLYRGVAHTTNATEPAEGSSVATPAVAPTVKERARALMMGRHRRVKQRQQVMLSRMDSQVGVASAEASRYWNHIQGKVHPTFGDNYDRSHVAFS